MDVRGSDFGSDNGYGNSGHDSDDVTDTLPPIIGTDERRMQVRAYNYWAGLLGKRRFPAPDELLAGKLPDFGPNAVLLHFSDGIEDPAVLALGSALAQECGEEGWIVGSPASGIARLSDVPGRSVLSRITDHYLQIIANEAPIGFEAEFVNTRGAAILYRGILLPFSTDDARIDYIYGVINWKELADQRTTDELMLEIGHALDQAPLAQAATAMAPARDTWADLPEDVPADGGWADGPVGFAPDATLDLAPFIDEALPDLAPSLAPGPTLKPAEPHTLSEWLEKARASALRAIANEDRTRHSLYAAIARAWDFALAADHAPDDYTRLLNEAGLRPQDRAPLIPLVKLVFGADYDKTRLTEYASVLGHARRTGLGKGELADVLARTAGGIKAIIAIERAARRGERAAPATSWQTTARKLPARPLSALPRDGAEFALVLVRRAPGGDPAMIGEISDDTALLARAARHISAS